MRVPSLRGCKNLTQRRDLLIPEAKSGEDKRKTSPYFNRKAAKDGKNRKESPVCLRGSENACWNKVVFCVCVQRSARPGGRPSRSGRLPALRTTWCRRRSSTTPGSCWWPPSSSTRPAVAHQLVFGHFFLFSFNHVRPPPQAGWPSPCCGSSSSATRRHRPPGRPTGSPCRS